MFDPAINNEISPTDTSANPSNQRKRGEEPARLFGASGHRVPRELIFCSSPRMRVAPIVSVPDRRYELQHNLIIHIWYHKDNSVEAVHKSLPVSGYGESPAEALSDFAEMFDVQYRGLVEDATENELSPGALKARQEFERYVHCVVGESDAEPRP